MPAQGQPSPAVSPSYSPLACGVRELANTMNLEQWGWLAYYPQLHRFHTNGPNCLLTSFTVKLRYPSGTTPPCSLFSSPSFLSVSSLLSLADSVSAEVRYNDDVPSGFADGSTGKPGGLVPQGDQFYSVNSSDAIYTYYTFYATARPGLALPAVDFYWLVLSLRQPMVSAWSAAEPNYNESITVDKVYYHADNGETQRLNGRTGMVTMYGCCDAPSPSPSTSPFALPVASSFANGPPDVDAVSIPTAQTTSSSQCAGNIIVGLSGNLIDLSYFIRLTGVSTTANVTTVAYIVDMSTAALLGQADVSAHMPTAANDTYTRVNASIRIRNSALVASRSYWLPFCFTATSGEGSIGMGGVAASGGKTTVGSCSGGPSCKPDLQSGSLATVITSTTTSGGGGGGGDTNIVAIAAGVAVGLVLVGSVVCLVVYIAYKRTRNRSELLPPVAGRRSSVRYTLLENELQRVPGDD
jgi:hypothetical protein